MNFCYLDSVKIPSFNQGKHVYVYIDVYMCIWIYVTICICVAVYTCVNEYIYLSVTVLCFAKVDHKSFSCISFLVF